MILEHGTEADDLIGPLFQTLTSRTPNVQEREILGALYDEQLEHFRANLEQASEFLQVGDTGRRHDPSIDTAELAASSVVGNDTFQL